MHKGIFEYEGLTAKGLTDKLKNTFDIEDVNINYIVSQSELGVLLIDKKFNLLGTADENDIAKSYLMIVPTGYNSQECGSPLCICFKKEGNKEHKYYCINTVAGILNKCLSNIKSADIRNNISKWIGVFNGYIEIRGAGWIEIDKYNTNIIDNISSEELDIQNISNDKKDKQVEIEVVEQPIKKKSSSNSAGMGIAEIVRNIYNEISNKSWKSSLDSLNNYIVYVIKKVQQEIAQGNVN
jgi:hypothetical protein